MSSKSAAEFFSKGEEALHNGHLYLARVCFENALKEEWSPSRCSYLARVLAESQGDLDTALRLAEEAKAAEPDNSEHYLNLARVFLAAGRKQEALEILRAGAQLFRSQEILRELESLGRRGKPVIAQLPRNHPLNKYLGMLLTWLGVRRTTSDRPPLA